jgi:transposase
MASIEDQMTAVYVFVDDFLKAHPEFSAWRTSPNDKPAFTDAEVITIGVMQGCFGVSTLKKAFQLIAANYRSAFPKLCSYQQWMARLHALSPAIGGLVLAGLFQYEMPDCFFIFDSKPIPMCKPIRNGRVRLLRDDGAYFGKNRAGWYFGFKLHALIHRTGVVLAAILTPANWNDRDPALALASCVSGGIALADLGYTGPELAQELFEEAGLLLITPQNAGASGSLISGLRERVETSFSALWDRFVDRVYSRSWNGLWNTIKLKLLHFNLCKAGLIPV